MKIIITGGAGYIGSHTAVEAIRAGHEVIIIDNLSNSRIDSIDNIGRAAGKRPLFINAEVTSDFCCFNKELKDYLIGAKALIHFAAFKSSPDSVDDPLGYYQNNIGSLVGALKLCETFGVENFIFSSSATVYGDPQFVPITEDHPILKGGTPYGSSKIVGEWILRDFTKAKRIKSVSLRYFNPAGADHTLMIGEFPLGKPANLVPIITQAAAKIIPALTITGIDFPTPDGSAIRDYIHVSDLALSHISALSWINNEGFNTFECFNIGTGTGTSVIEMVKSFIQINKDSLLEYNTGPRRLGDPPEVWCDPQKAKKILGWEAKLDVSDILESAWKWEKKIRNI